MILGLFLSFALGDQIPDGLSCSKRTNRIVNGVQAEENLWPWLVQLSEVGRTPFCGGAVVKNNWVISAAHCCEEIDTDSLIIKAGQYQISKQSGNERIVKVLNIFIHELYKSKQDNYDFCLIKTENMELDGETRDTLCLPQSGQHIAPNDNRMRGPSCFVAGWGFLVDSSVQTEDQSYLPDVLQSVQINVFSDQFCIRRSQYSEGDLDFNSQFCGGHLDGSKDACQGDSGGPLVCVENESPVIYGVVSTGMKCGDPDFPGIYAKVSEVIPWIENAILDTRDVDNPESTPPNNEFIFSGSFSSCQAIPLIVVLLVILHIIII